MSADSLAVCHSERARVSVGQDRLILTRLRLGDRKLQSIARWTAKDAKVRKDLHVYSICRESVPSVGQECLLLPRLRSGDRKRQMSDNCIVRGLLAFCCLKQDVQDLQDFQDAGVLCSQLRSVRTSMSIVERASCLFKVC